MEKTCLYCGFKIPQKKKYCNRNCYNEDHYIYLDCKGCGSKFKAVKNQSYRLYCGIKCANQNIDRKETRKKAQETLIKKHGVDNPFEVFGYDKIVSSRDKGIISSKISESWTNKTEEEKDIIKNKISLSLKNKTEEEKIEIQNKIKQTNLERYGAEYTVSKGSSLRYKIEKRWKDNFYKKLVIWLKTNDLELLDEYKGTRDKEENIIYYNFKHTPTGTVFIDHLACGRLPIYKDPSMTHGTSMLEKEVSEFIKQNYDLEVINNNKKIIKGLEIDIYLPDIKLAVEFNGLKWHSETHGKERTYHLYKTEECEKQGIQLIHIFEDEWNYKQDIVKSKILNLLRKTPNKIYARNCEIKEISDNKIISDFLNEHHIQGNSGSKIKLGLYHQNNLTALMTFGEYRKITGIESKENEYELIRYCSALNYNVIGGFSKLMKYFINKYNPVRIISFADRRYSTGKVYENNGFAFIKNTPPNYWYLRTYKQREHRFKYRKSELKNLLSIFDPIKSEWENMKTNKYDRIWDCGSKKYEWIKK